jgi:glycosyltransferase involved in cell wall biosynthesis
MTFAINLLPSLLRMGGGTRVVTNFHEMYLPFSSSLKRDIGAVWQRAVALLLASSSQAVSVTATEWARRLGRLGFGKHVHLIPVGSNIPKVELGEVERVRLRRQVLGGSEGLLVAAFGAKHDRDVPSALHGLRELKRVQPAKLLWIGGGAPVERHQVRIRDAMVLNGIGEGDVLWTGQLSHPEISKLLGACDLMMLPFTDGVSTRRTSAVTALQHGVPLLTTSGAKPEPWFVHAQNAYLVPQGDTTALVNGLLELAGNPGLRTRIALGGRALYEAQFSWEVIAQLVSSLARGQSTS